MNVRNTRISLTAATLFASVCAPALVWAHPDQTPSVPATADTHERIKHTASGEPAPAASSEDVSASEPRQAEVPQAETPPALQLGPAGFKQWGTQPVAPPAVADTAPAGPTLPDYVGKIGLGFHNFNTPIGLRMWLTPTFGFDVGVGGNIDGVFDDSVPSWGVAAEGGLLISLVRLENMIVLVRGGLQVDFDDRGESSDNLALNLEGLIGIEYFLTALGLPNLSLSAGLSITARVNWREDSEQVNYEVFTSFRDFDFVETASLGFHFYF